VVRASCGRSLATRRRRNGTRPQRPHAGHPCPGDAEL